MNRKDAWLGSLCGALALWALWPCWLDARYVPANYGDLYSYHYPMRHLIVETLQRGRLPFWNPYIFSGLPLAANPQGALFYPLSVLSAFWPLSLALSWDMLFHLFWAMLGTALLARRSGLSAAAAWTLALLYSLSPFLIYRVVEGIPTLLASLAWAPWCWLAWRGGRPGWLGAVWALQLLSGHPQFLIVNAVGMALWAACSPRKIEAAVGLGREALWSLGLAFVQWATTWEFVGRSVRRSWPAEYALAYALKPEALLSLLWPGLLGRPGAGTFDGPPSVFFETYGLWIGLVGLAAAAAGLAVKKRRLGPILLLGAGLLLAAGAHGPLGRAALVGALSLLRTPSRWLLLCLWGLCLCAGAGLAWAGRRGRAAAAGLFLAAALELLCWDARFMKSELVMDYMKPSSLFSEILGGATRRIITGPDLANPNKTSLYHVRNANGYEAFYLDGYPQYVARSEGHAAADASRTYLSRLGTPELDRLGVFWKVSGKGLETTKDSQPLAYFVDANGRIIPPYPFLPRLDAERWSARGPWPAKAARLVAAQPLYPGWKAWINGVAAPLTLWDEFLQALKRPEGLPDGAPVNVEWRYAPTAWTWLIALTALSWAAWLRLVRRAA